MPMKIIIGSDHAGFTLKEECRKLLTDVFGARVIGEGLALEMVKIFLATDFEGGRHKMRIDKIDN